MKHLEDYFKTRKEVNNFFDKEMFKFSFMSDGCAFFESLKPTKIAGDYLTFQLCFYYEDQEFFNYSSFEDSLDELKLSCVVCEDLETKESCNMYFCRYDEEEII